MEVNYCRVPGLVFEGRGHKGEKIQVRGTGKGEHPELQAEGPFS